MKAIIAAGGSGTRLRPLTFSSNKHLLPVANKPLLLYPFETIVDLGIKEIGLIVNETKESVKSLLGDGSAWGVKVTYITQEKPLGLAHVVKISEAFLAGEPFIYHLGDNIFSRGIRRPFEHFANTKPDGLLTIVEHAENRRLGVPYFDESGKLIKVVEKPQNPPNKYGVPGLYFFNYHVFEAFSGSDAIVPSARGELEITDLYTYLLDHNYRVETEEVEGRWMDPGKFTDMLEANAYLLDQREAVKIEGEVDGSSTIEGKVTIGHGSRIVNSQLIGPVDIAADCIVQNSRIGPHVSVSHHCKLEDVTIENSIIMQDNTIFAVSETIKDSLIGKNTEVWEEKQESVSLFIGDHCRVRLT
jgi:glucose-1-phosphate thymidylyltransferase